MIQPLDELDLSEPCDLIVLTPKNRAIRCRRPGDSQVVTVRAGTMGVLVPGQIVTLQPTKAWRFNGHPYLSGEIQRTRIDPAALGMPRLSLNDYGWWDPLAELDVDELEPWEKEILALGPRRCFEMEQVLPGAGPPEDLSDPILDAVDLRHAGDGQGADELLFGALEADLRCLDAHAHLAGAAFEAAPSLAIDSAEVGVRIGQWSLGEAFDGVLPWQPARQIANPAAPPLEAPAALPESPRIARAWSTTARTCAA